MRPFLLLKGSAHKCEQLSCLFIGLCGCDEVDVHSAGCVNLIVLNLGEYELLLQTEGLIASAVERVGVDASEIAYTGKCNVEKSVEELVHDIAAKCNLNADNLTLSELEVCNRLLGAAGNRLLTCDNAQLVHNCLDNLLVFLCFAAANVTTILSSFGICITDL